MVDRWQGWHGWHESHATASPPFSLCCPPWWSQGGQIWHLRFSIAPLSEEPIQQQYLWCGHLSWLSLAPEATCLWLECLFGLWPGVWAPHSGWILCQVPPTPIVLSLSVVLFWPQPWPMRTDEKILLHIKCKMKLSLSFKTTIGINEFQWHSLLTKKL